MSLLQLRKSYTNKVSDVTVIFFSTRSFELRWLWVCLCVCVHAGAYACAYACACVCARPRITLCPQISYNVSFIEGINWQQSHLIGTLMNLLAMPGCAAVSVLQPEGSHTLGTQTLHTASSLRYHSGSDVSVGQEERGVGTATPLTLTPSTCWFTPGSAPISRAVKKSSSWYAAIGNFSVFTSKKSCPSLIRPINEIKQPSAPSQPS